MNEKRYLAEIGRLKREVSQLQGLLEYARDFIPRCPEVNVPPPGYWVDEDHRWGHCLGGSLQVLGQQEDREAAVAAANYHHQKEK